MKIRSTIAIGLLAFVLCMLTLIIITGAGGERALFLIIGHLVAWAEIVIIFYFRKKPGTEE